MTERAEEETRSGIVVYPHSGVCERCQRDRDDLFYHAQDGAYYCADVFRCEGRYYIQGERPAASPSGTDTDG